MKQNKKLKITFVQGLNPLETQGISGLIMDLSQKLSALNTNVTVASPTSQQNQLIQNVEIIKLENTQSLKQVIENSDCVIPMYGFSPSSTKPLALSTAKICEQMQIPFFPMFHTTDKTKMFNQNFGVSDFTADLNTFLMLESCKSQACKKIFGVSKAVNDALLQNGISKNKLVLAPNGIDLTNLPKGQQSKDTDVIFVGRLEPEKGIIQLLLALKLVKKKLPDIKVKIIGTGTESAQCVSLIKIFKLEKNVQMLGKLEKQQTLKNIQSAKVLVNTSYTESFGLVIIEALALGVSVIAPDIEGPKEILGRNKLFGTTFEQGNTKDLATKIVKYIEKSEELASAQGANNSIVLKNFDISTQARIILETLQKNISQPPFKNS